VVAPSFVSLRADAAARHHDRVVGHPRWALWNLSVGRRYTLGVEEEVMLLEADRCSLAQSSDQVLDRLSGELSLHTSPETHASVIELTTGIHLEVKNVVAELGSLRAGLEQELTSMGLAVATAGTHPLTVAEDTKTSAAPRYRRLGESLRALAHREPTMALHVHVGVPAPEDAIRLLNGLRRHIPVLLALAANSPFVRGRDLGFASGRTVLFQAFPRTGLSRAFDDYDDYVESVDALIGSGAIPDPSFLWWDVRLQPALGTVEVRVMDAQSSLGDVAPLVALIQSLSRLELERDSPPFEPGVEVLAENRFLAARDGMSAHLIDVASRRRLVPVRKVLDELIAECRPHAVELGCADALDGVRWLAAFNGADRQRAVAAGGHLEHLVSTLADRFQPPRAHHPVDGRRRADLTIRTRERSG
jgi:glutamate---cysteine ligase / carboxylate-amine ligase